MFFKNLRIKTSRRSSKSDDIPKVSQAATKNVGQRHDEFQPERAILPAEEEIERKREASKLTQLLGGELNASASSVASSTKLAKILGTDLSLSPTDAYNMKRSAERLVTPNISRQSLLAREYGIDLDDLYDEAAPEEETPVEPQFEFLPTEMAPTEPDTAPRAIGDDEDVHQFYDAAEFSSPDELELDDDAPALDDQILSLGEPEIAESGVAETEDESHADLLPPPIFEHRGSHDSAMSNSSMPPLTQAPSLESEPSPAEHEVQHAMHEDYFNSARFERAASLSGSDSETESPAETIVPPKCATEAPNSVELDHFAIVCERLMSELDDKLERAASGQDVHITPVTIPLASAPSSTSTSTSPSIFQPTEPGSPVSSCSSAESSLKNVRVAFRAAETSLNGDKMAEQQAAKAKLAAARDALKRVRSNIVVPMTEQQLAPALGLRISSSTSSPNLNSQILPRSRQNSISSNKSSSSLSSLISESDKSERSRPRASRRSRTFDGSSAPTPRKAEISIGVAQPRNINNAQPAYKGASPQNAITHAHPRVPGRPSTGTPVVRQGGFGGQSTSMTKSKSSSYIPHKAMHNIHEVLA